MECQKRPTPQEQQDGPVLRDTDPRGSYAHTHTYAHTQNWPLFSRRSFSFRFKPWSIPQPKLAAGSTDCAASTLTGSRDFPRQDLSGEQAFSPRVPENYSPITDLLDDGCKRPFLEQKERILSSHVPLNQKGILPISMLPTFQYQGCGAFPPATWLPGLTWSISSSWALAPGHSTATFTMSEGGGIAPDSSSCLYNSIHPHTCWEKGQWATLKNISIATLHLTPSFKTLHKTSLMVCWAS